MSNIPLRLHYLILLGGKILDPIRFNAFTHFTPGSFTSTKLDDPLQIPPEMRSELPRRLFWVQGEQFLDAEKSLGDQHVRKDDTIILTDLEDNKNNRFFLKSVGEDKVEKSRNEEQIEQFSSAVATRLREELVSAGRISTGIEEGYVFIAMAMAPSDPSLVDVHDAIVRTAKGLQLHAERIDDVQTNTKITDRIIESLEKAEFVVVDITHSRPNVFFEAGYAQGIGKIPIYIAREGTNVEFDIKDYPIIFFKNLKELEENLAKRLEALIESERIVNKRLTMS